MFLKCEMLRIFCYFAHSFVDSGTYVPDVRVVSNYQLSDGDK